MSKYQKSIIYKIYDNTNGNVYYGSTYNLLRVRMNGHKTDAKRNNKCRSQSIILNNDYSYSMIEPYPCNSKQELKTRERYWIENFECVNKQVPGRTDKEYYNDTKEQQAEYRAKNKDRIKKNHADYYAKNKEELNKRNAEYRTINNEQIVAQQAEYYAKNKEKISEKKAGYYVKNKEEIKKKRAEYCVKNKEQIKEKFATKIVCECGCEVSQYTINRHRKTAKHAKLLALICPPCNDTPSSHLQK